MTIQQQISFEFNSPNSLELPAEAQAKQRTLDEVKKIASHPVFELGAALFRGSMDDRVRRLLLLDRMIDLAGNSVASDGTVRDLSIVELQGLIPEFTQDDVADLVHKMSADGLIVCQGKYYQPAPLAASLAQFVRFVSNLEDETGASAAVISSVFSYQLEVGASINPTLAHPGAVNALKTVILDLDHYNSRLESVIRHSVLSDLGTVVHDLNAVDYFCGIVEGLVHQLSAHETPGDVYWQERARRVLSRFQELANVLTHAYQIRLQRYKSGGGRYVSDEILEKWLVHVLVDEQKHVCNWVDELNKPANIATIPAWWLLSVAKEGPPAENTRPYSDLPPLVSDISIDDTIELDSSEDAEKASLVREIVDMIIGREGKSFRITDLVDENDWAKSAIRITYLSSALEIVEQETGERWTLDPSLTPHHFAASKEVSSVTETEVGKWSYLTQKGIERVGL
jgi:hypothetical protein